LTDEGSNEDRPPSEPLPPPPPVPPATPPPAITDGPSPPGERRRAPVVWIALVVVLVLVGGAVAFLLTRGGGGTDLTYSLRPGSSTQYRVTVIDSGTNTDADTQYSVTTETTLGFDVRSVGEDGTATVVAKAGDATITGDDHVPTHLDALGDQTTRITDDGRMLDSVLLVADPEGTFFGLLDPLFPIVSTEGVSPGDTWNVEATQAMTLGSGTTTLTGTATLTKFDTVGGAEVAVITSHLTEAWDLDGNAADVAELAGGSSTSTGSVRWRGTEEIEMTSEVDTATSEVVRSTLTGNYDIAITNLTGDTPGQPVHNTGTFEQKAERTGG
jgi:hypothetical protein